MTYLDFVAIICSSMARWRGGGGVAGRAPGGGEEGTNLHYGIVGRHLRPGSEIKRTVYLKKSSPREDGRQEWAIGCPVVLGSDILDVGPRANTITDDEAKVALDVGGGNKRNVSQRLLSVAVAGSQRLMEVNNTRDFEENRIDYAEKWNE